MKPNLFKSRKFWIMICDMSISTATYFITVYIAPELAKDILWVIAMWQPAVYALINSIGVEDAAAMAAGLVK